MIFHKASGRMLLYKPAKRVLIPQPSMENSATKGASREEIKANVGLTVTQDDVEPDKSSKSSSR